MPDNIEPLTTQQEAVIPLKKDVMDDKQVKLWLNRCRTVNKFHRSEIVEKYKIAKKRYNCENYGYQKTRNRYTHETFNFLYKDIEDFNGSVYYKNPELDLTCRDTGNPDAVRNIENLEQIVNDDIKDNRNLKALIRTLLIDEGLSGLGAVYLDYDYRTQDSQELIDPNIPGQYQQEEVANKVRPCRILPENIIRPPFQTLYNYQDSPYLGYIDIVSLECLKNDPTLNQAMVGLLKGKQYADLTDIDKAELKKQDVELKDDLLFEKIYTVFIKGDDKKPLKRLVLSDDTNLREPLAYEDWTKGNGTDDRGYPLHLLALNDPAEGFVPPSEAWILESILCIIDYLMNKTMKHLKRSRTRTLVKGGKEGLKKEEITKWLKDEDLELIALHNLPPNVDIRSLIFQIADQELSKDHESVFALCKRVFDELSRKPAMAQVAVVEKQKTATETQAIQQQDNSQSAYKVDKFKDFLESFFYDWAKLTQRNMKGIQNISIKNKDTGMEEPREVYATEDRNDMDGSFNVDANIQTFVAPNKEVKRRIVKETLLDLQAIDPSLRELKKKVNPERVVQELLQTVDMRDPEGFLMDIPLRNVDQQILDLTMKGIPLNINDIGGDLQGALKRTMEIFGDHEMIARMEPMVPGVGLPNGPLANFARDLEGMIQQSQGRVQQRQTQAKTDVALNASQMAGAVQ